MLRLIDIELFKIKHSRSAKVMTILYFSLFLSAALLSTIKFNIGSIEFRLADQGIYNFPFTWHFMSYMVAMLKIILAIVIVSMMSSEYTHRTIKQNLIDGLSKKEFILSKFYVVVIYSFVSTVVLFLVVFTLGLIFSDYTELQIIFRDLEYLVAYFVKLLGFFTLCMFLGLLVRRSAFALGFLLLLFISELVLGHYVPLVENFTPLNAMSGLIEEPFSRFDAVKTAAKTLDADILSDYSVKITNIVTVLGWTALFVFGSFKLLEKRDL